MEKITEIPHYLRYDFFMSVLGILICYFVYMNALIYADFLLRVLFLILGSSCLLYGIFEMKRNYEAEKQIEEKERIYKLKRIMLDLILIETETKKVR